MKLRYADRLRRRFLRVQLGVLLRLRLIDVYQPIFGLENTDSLRRDATVGRWAAISKELGNYTGSAMDIGCNNGFFTLHLASMGYVCLGIESAPSLCYLCNLIKEIHSVSTATFINSGIEDILEKLPRVDGTLFLSLFHHLVRVHGFDEATSILTDLLSKTNRVMFFETGQSNERTTSWSKYMPNMGAEPRQWIQDYLVGLGVKNVKWLGDFETHLSPIR